MEINLMKKNVVAGLGEIGLPLYKLFSKNTPTIGYDLNSKLMNKTRNQKYENLETSFLHICIPFTNNFKKNVFSLYKKFNPEGIIIHSTIEPSTTSQLQSKLPIPVIYSATRGIHKRMGSDMKRYSKFFAIEPKSPKEKWASLEFTKLMRECKIKTKKMSTPKTLELAKIVVDTSYYGWLINYAQLSNMIAIENNVNYDEMWTFAEEIHKFLGNRPKMFPGFIGGHCVIPNLDLIHHQTLDLIKKLNQKYDKKVKNARKISKKYQDTI